VDTELEGVWPNLTCCSCICLEGMRKDRRATSRLPVSGRRFEILSLVNFARSWKPVLIFLSVLRYYCRCSGDSSSDLFCITPVTIRAS